MRLSGWLLGGLAGRGMNLGAAHERTAKYVGIVVVKAVLGGETLGRQYVEHYDSWNCLLLRMGLAVFVSLKWAGAHMDIHSSADKAA